MIHASSFSEHVFEKGVKSALDSFSNLIQSNIFLQKTKCLTVRKMDCLLSYHFNRPFGRGTYFNKQGNVNFTK